MNICDTTIINVTVKRTGPAFYTDTLYLNQNETFCDWDLTNLFGPITSIQNDCPASSGMEVFFDLDATSFCMTYDAMAAGKDTACIILTDDLGNMDTTIAVICVIPPMFQTITEDIRLTTNTRFCIDTTELAGTIISIDNICEEEGGESVEFIIDTLNLCVDAAPITLGTDSACIVICDDFGVCDTTILAVTVSEEDLGAPQTFDDIDTTNQNMSVIIDACFNDTIPPSLPLTNFFVLPVTAGGAGPTNGTAFSNTDCTISYTPIDNFCGTDLITYVACNAMGCDTATITVEVLCPPSEFEIFNAFSPNGDGVNDAFKINGLDQFPNHELRVYNRWGNEVLVRKNYQNDWEGEWQGLDLPDGTYFYVLDTGQGETRTGYVYISR
jgi:gliding motility-associated-like protein